MGKALCRRSGKGVGSIGAPGAHAGLETITPVSSFADYTAWIQGAIDRLDALTDDDQVKCQVVSHCAHVFLQERIDHLREIYCSRPFDDILREMYRDA